MENIGLVTCTDDWLLDELNLILSYRKLTKKDKNRIRTIVDILIERK